MTFTRSPLTAAAALAACGFLVQCGDEQDMRPRVERAVHEAVAALVARQSDDGAWRSQTYGTLADGPELTPTVLKAVMLAPETALTRDACARGLSYLDTIPYDTVLDYPVYTAALAVIIYHRAGRAAQRDAWVEVLRGHQLDDRLGWRVEDAAFGGWGYAVLPVTRPDTGRPPFDADLSSTLFAVGALRLAGVPSDDPVFRNALGFVKRCQNFDSDGGFFLTPTNEAQNKAGVAGTDPDGTLRYRSYGSATADGVRALLRCGLGPDHPRVQAALAWIARYFTAETNPGSFPRGLERDRDAAYYYWCWSVSHALRILEIETLVRDGQGAIDWRRALAEALLEGQQPDGTWRNDFSFLKEDDPLIATSLAVAALANCHAMLPSGPPNAPAIPSYPRG